MGTPTRSPKKLAAASPWPARKTTQHDPKPGGNYLDKHRGPDEVKRALSEAEVFAQHSVTGQDGDMESFGVSLAEAMASSVPVVTTNHNGFRETVADGETGLLVEEHDLDGMAAAMLSLLNDPERAEAMGRAGRARVEARFTHDRTAARLREIMGLAC